MTESSIVSLSIDFPTNRDGMRRCRLTLLNQFDSWAFDKRSFETSSSIIRALCICQHLGQFYEVLEQ